MFGQNKWSKWFDSLPAHTQEYIKNQPVWHDKDIALFCSIAMAVGFFFGWLAGH